MTNSKLKANNLDGILEKIYKDDEFIKFLSEHSIADIDQVLAIHQYKVDQNRIGIIVDVTEADRNDTTKIVFDFKKGKPTVNQIYDVLYDQGKDCDIKIIAYSGEQNDNDKGIPIADDNLVAGLVGELQQLNVPIYLMSYDSSTQKLKVINLFGNSISVDRSSSWQIPPKESFLFDTFWSIYFNSFNDYYVDKTQGFGQEVNPDDWGHKIYIDCVFDGEIDLYWNSKGVRYVVTQTDDTDEYLKRILGIDMPALKQRYGDNAVRFENKVGRLPRLYIQFSEKPLSWLNTATSKEITEFAHKLYNDAWALRYQFESSAEKLFEMEPALV